MVDHQFERDPQLPEWHGWHAARRGLGTNLYRLGIPEKTIQAILRQANVSTTTSYYIKTAAADAQEAMAKTRNRDNGQRLGNGRGPAADCHIAFAFLKVWWRRLDSNQRPTDYETVALTT